MKTKPAKTVKKPAKGGKSSTLDEKALRGVAGGSDIVVPRDNPELKARYTRKKLPG